ADHAGHRQDRSRRRRPVRRDHLCGADRHAEQGHQFMTDLRTQVVDKDGYPAAGEDAPATSGPPRGNGYGVLEWLRWGWRQLTSMRIALILLFLLALGAIPGSMLPQQGSDPGGVQQYFRAHPSVAPLLNHLGLFNVFAAPWFAA